MKSQLPQHWLNSQSSASAKQQAGVTRDPTRLKIMTTLGDPTIAKNTAKQPERNSSN